MSWDIIAMEMKVFAYPSACIGRNNTSILIGLGKGETMVVLTLQLAPGSCHAFLWGSVFRHHSSYLRQEVQNDNITISWISTNDMIG